MLQLVSVAVHIRLGSMVVVVAVMDSQQVEAVRQLAVDSLRVLAAAVVVVSMVVVGVVGAASTVVAAVVVAANTAAVEEMAAVGDTAVVVEVVAANRAEVVEVEVDCIHLALRVLAVAVDIHQLAVVSVPHTGPIHNIPN